jgi:hypothetical protein
MIIYSGMGPFALVVFLVFLAAGSLLSEPLSGKPDAFFHNTPMMLASFFVAGVIVWFLGRRMNRAPLQTAEFASGARQSVARAKHTLYRVPMEYWGPILFALFSAFILYPR